MEGRNNQEIVGRKTLRQRRVREEIDQFEPQARRAPNRSVAMVKPDALWDPERTHHYYNDPRRRQGVRVRKNNACPAGSGAGLFQSFAQGRDLVPQQLGTG